MAKSFVITTTATDQLRADAKGHAQAVFTVTNTTVRPIRGLAKAKPLGDTKREWLSVQGEAERDFAAGATQQFTVSFDGPVGEPGGATPAGSTAPTGGAPAASVATAQKYPFRLDVASAQDPEEDFTEGQVVTVEMMPTAVTPRKKFPLWIIFVIVGVLLLIGVVVLILALRDGGKPNNNGKVSASPTPTISRPTGRFEGKWVNADPETRGITRLEIDQNGAQLRVHAWGKCHPTDCDWGPEKGSVIGNSGEVTWDQGFALVKMVMTLQGENQLKVVTDTVFNDTRPRMREEYIFNRQS